MIYGTIIPEFPKPSIEFIIFLFGFTLAFIYLLNHEKCTPHWQLQPSFLLITLLPLICCCCHLIEPYEKSGEQDCTHYMHGGMVALLLLFIANGFLYFLRHHSMDGYMAHYYKHGIVDARDLRMLKLDLHSGCVNQVIGILMWDARRNRQMNRYHDLYCLYKNMQEKERLANQDMHHRKLLPYQKHFFCKTLENMLDSDSRNYL